MWVPEVAANFKMLDLLGLEYHKFLHISIPLVNQIFTICLGYYCSPRDQRRPSGRHLSRLPNGPMGGSPIVEQVRISHLPLDALQNLSKFVG